MARDTFAGSASSGLPVLVAQAAPCFLDQLDLARHQGRASQETNI
jgi:hypothetical protein